MYNPRIIAVKSQDGSLIGQEDDGYIIENIHLWSVKKANFSPKKYGYINKVGPNDVKNTLIKVINEFIKELNINA